MDPYGQDKCDIGGSEGMNAWDLYSVPEAIASYVLPTGSGTTFGTVLSRCSIRIGSTGDSGAQLTYTVHRTSAQIRHSEDWSRFRTVVRIR
jgi:hypothetical protein